MERETIDDALELVIEHEAIHSGICGCFVDIYCEVRDQFRSQFRQAGFPGKIKIFLDAIPFLGNHVVGNEEWAVETLQRPART